MTSDDPILSRPRHQQHQLERHHVKSTESSSSKLRQPSLHRQSCSIVHATAHRYETSTTRFRTAVQRSERNFHVLCLSLDSSPEKDDDAVVSKPSRRRRELIWPALILPLLMGGLVILIFKHVCDLVRFQLHIHPRVLLTSSHTINNNAVTVTTITGTLPNLKRAVTTNSIPESTYRNANETRDDFFKAYDIAIRNITSTQGLSRASVEIINNAKKNTLSPNDTFPTPVHCHPVYIALEPYLRWHAAQLKCIHDPQCFYSGIDTDNSDAQTQKRGNRFQQPRVLLWICPRSNRRACHGVGDRFRGIVSAFAYAILTKRIFLVHWTDNPHALTTAVIPGVIDWRVPSHMFSDINSEFDYIDVPDGRINISAWPRIETTAFPDMKWVQAPPGYTLLDQNRSLNEDGATYDSGINLSNSNNGSEKRQNIRSLKRKILARHTNFFEKENVALVDSLPQLAMQSRGTFAVQVYRHAGWEARFPSLRNWTSRQGYHINRIMLRLLFKPSPVAKHLLTNTVKQLDASRLRTEQVHANGDSSGTNSSEASASYVAVHVRTGIDVGETKLSRFKSQHLVQGAKTGVFSQRFYTLVEEVIHCLQQKSGIQNSRERVFFASDSLALKQVFSKLAGKHGIDVFYTNVSAMHVEDDSWVKKKKKKKKKDMAINQLNRNIAQLSTSSQVQVSQTEVGMALKNDGEDVGTNEDEELARFINVFVEFFGIANGSAVVASTSEFSRLAYVMSDAKWLVKMNVAKQGNTNWTACPQGV